MLPRELWEGLLERHLKSVLLDGSECSVGRHSTGGRPITETLAAAETITEIASRNRLRMTVRKEHRNAVIYTCCLPCFGAGVRSLCAGNEQNQRACGQFLPTRRSGAHEVKVASQA
jgi:hypothetical protein